MAIPESFSLNATIAPVAFAALQQTLQQATQFIREHESDADIYIVQETSLGFDPIHQLQVERFTLVISCSFSALLLANTSSPSSDGGNTQKIGQARHRNGHYENRQHGHQGDKAQRDTALRRGGKDYKEKTYDVKLIFAPKAIANFLEGLLSLIPPKNTLQTSLRQGLALIQPNQPKLQSQFALKLIAELIQLLQPSVNLDFSEPSPIYSGPSTRPISSETLHQSELLHQVVSQTQAVDRAKSEFLAAMSHELRTPLTYILGMSATLLRWSAPGSSDEIPERQRRYLQNIHDQGEHLLELINDLLDLSQLESGRLELDFQEFSLSLLIQQILNIYRKKAHLKGVILELDSHTSQESDRITADPHRLQQIVSNLLSNAIKFTPQGGRVTVRLSADQQWIEIQVRDTGIGISEHHQPLIFQKFKQLDSSYHREYEGTGLGLALTKQLIDLHRGWIECDSTIGIGTVFTVKLPRHPFSNRSPSQIPKRPTSSSHPLGRIVLVDNNDESGHFMSDMLTAAGYQLVWMLEGLTAISQLEMLQPAVVIINEQLIDNDAGTANIVKILRQNPITKRARIMVLSHHSLSMEYQEDNGMDIDLVLSHPIQPEELLHKVGMLMATAHSNLSA